MTPLFETRDLYAGLVALCLSACLFGQGDIDWHATMPIDPDLKVGQLDNGLRFYIRENQKPEGRAMLRLVVNVGSLQEEEDEQGLAHFLEHMAFNGTKNFRKHELIDFLEGVGMRFGSHLNASTSFNETIYKLEVPVGDPETLDKAFLILEDWASNIQFEEEEIEKERGVVIEEWRARKGVGQRLSEKQLPLLYFGSKYVDRLPIGLVPVIESLTREQFVDFYTKWYRPELMAVVAVGDFDADLIESKIRSHFAHLENPADSPERTTYPIADHEGTLFSIETDPELSASSLGIVFKTELREQGTAHQYRQSLVERIYFSLINGRLRERAQKENPPYTGAGLGRGSLGREKSYYRLGVGLIGNDYEGGVKSLMQEVDRARRDGFEQSELDRIKVRMLRGLEQAYDERDKRQSSSFLREYTSNFLENEPIPGLEFELNLTRSILSDLKLSEVNAVGAFVDRTDNRVALYAATENETFRKPTTDELLAAMRLTPEDSLGAYDDGVSEAPILTAKPIPGSIVEEIYHESIDTYEWVLSNDVRVIAKATDFKNDEILVSAFSPGGTSLFEDDEIVSGRFATGITSQSGLGRFDAIELRKKRAGKIARAQLGISGEYESVRGSASPKDLEHFFQILHMRFMEPRLDLEAFRSMKKRMISSVENRLKSPNAVFSDAITEALFGGHPRHRPMSLKLIEEIDPQLSFELYKERFADASDFTFVFIGSLDIEELKKYLLLYVASLPDLDREETHRFNGDSPVGGKLNVVVEKNLENKSSVQVLFHGEAQWSPENSYALGFTTDILRMRFRESMREEAGKVYGAGVSGSLIRIPQERFSSGFSFTCDPGNVESLIAIGRNEIRNLQENGPNDVDVEKVRQQRLRSHEKGMEQNGYWMSGFSNYLRTERPLDSILEAPKRAMQFKATAAQEAAKRYFDHTNVLVAILNPLPETSVEK